MLTDVEREHLFLLGLGRPPEVHYQAAEGVTPRLQRVLDALEFSPAFIKTPIWDVRRLEPRRRGGADRLRHARRPRSAIFCA